MRWRQGGQPTTRRRRALLAPLLLLGALLGLVPAAHAAATATPAAPVPQLTNAEQSNATISPNADGQADVSTLAVTLTQPGVLTARVLGADGSTVRTIWSGAMPAGVQQLAWDGTRDDGSVVTAGCYTVDLALAAVAGGPTVSDQQLQTCVDLTAPTLVTPKAAIHVFDNDRTISLPIRLSEPSMVTVTVDGASADRQPLELVEPAGASTITTITSDALFGTHRAGSYTIHLAASDPAWNATTAAVTVDVSAAPRPTRDRTGQTTFDGQLPAWLQPIMARALKADGLPATWIHSRGLYETLLHESGFNPTAKNPTSTAYGMFQFLNYTWAIQGGSVTSDPYLQCVYGLRYIHSRYGNPDRAWAFHLTHNWY